MLLIWGGEATKLLLTEGFSARDIRVLISATREWFTKNDKENCSDIFFQSFLSKVSDPTIQQKLMKLDVTKEYSLLMALCADCSREDTRASDPLLWMSFGAMNSLRDCFLFMNQSLKFQDSCVDAYDSKYWLAKYEHNHLVLESLSRIFESSEDFIVNPN